METPITHNEELVEVHGAAQTSHASVVADETLLQSLGINGQLFLFQLINFVIVAVIIWFLILKPLSKKMTERQAYINESLDNAKAIETNLHMAERTYQDRIDEAKVDSNKLMARATEEGRRMIDKMKEKTTEEIALLVDQAKKNISIDREKMQDELRDETVGMVIQVSQKFIHKKLDEKGEAAYITEMISTIDAQKTAV